MYLRKWLIAKDSVINKENRYLRKCMGHGTQKQVTSIRWALWRTFIIFNSQHPGSRSFYFHFMDKIGQSHYMTWPACLVFNSCLFTKPRPPPWGQCLTDAITLAYSLNWVYNKFKDMFLHFPLLNLVIVVESEVVCFDMNKMEFLFWWNKSVKYDWKTVQESSYCGVFVSRRDDL